MNHRKKIEYKELPENKKGIICQECGEDCASLGGFVDFGDDVFICPACCGKRIVSLEMSLKTAMLNNQGNFCYKRVEALERLNELKDAQLVAMEEFWTRVCEDLIIRLGKKEEKQKHDKN